MGVYIGKKEVGLILQVTTATDNISVMKIADFMSNTQKGTNYNLTDEEYKEAHRELQKLINKQMYGGEDE